MGDSSPQDWIPAERLSDEDWTYCTIPIAPEFNTVELRSVARTLEITGAEEETILEEIVQVSELFVNAEHFRATLPALNALLVGIRTGSLRTS